MLLLRQIHFNRHDVSEIKERKTNIHTARKKPLSSGLKDSDVTLLIGTDYTDLFLHIDFGQRQNGEPTVVKVTLFWVLIRGNKKNQEKR